MFKRVEKRRLKKEEEEELGIDEDMKEILGMHDTDSEESASDSDDSDDAEEDDEQEQGEEGEEESGDEGQSGVEDGEDQGEDEEDPDVTVSQALKDSIYVVSILPEVKACIVCPGKLLKGVKMVQLHRISNAHERRLKQFKVLSANAEPDESAWEILQRGSEEKPKLSLTPSEGATSKRAEKKKAQAAKLKLRREKAKAKRAKEALNKKALAAASPSGSSPEKVPMKTSKPTTDSEKSSKKDLSKKEKASNSKPKATSPPTKKRKVEETPTDKIDSPSAADQTPSMSLKKVKKPKHKKVESNGPEVHPDPVSPKKDTVTVEVKESVKDVARSISDQAKIARQRAMSTSKESKGNSHPRRKKLAAVS